MTLCIRRSLTHDKQCALRPVRDAFGQVEHGHRLHPVIVAQGNEVLQNGAQVFHIGLGRTPEIMRVPPKVIVLPLPRSLGHLTFYAAQLRLRQKRGR